MALGVWLRGAHHLERELRHAVAELLQRQILEHHIGRAAIGRHIARPLDGFHFRIGQLVLGASVDAHIEAVARDLAAVGPDAANAGDLALADGNREADRIAIVAHGGTRRALAAARNRNRFGKIGGPDHMPAHAHAPVDLGNRVALSRTGQAEAFDLPLLDRLGAVTHDALINRAAQCGPRQTAHGRRRDPQKRAAHRRTRRR